VGGGVPLSRPDLHFVYNLVETCPLVAAFVHELRALPRFGAQPAPRTPAKAKMPA
jgi:hypothetical protein